MIITEPEFRKYVRSLRGTFRPSSEDGPLFVTGPGRSGAIASVYASHLWGAAFLPFGEIADCPPGDILVVDTAQNTGKTLRKAAKRYPGSRQVAFYREGEAGTGCRIHFWYEGCVNGPGCHPVPHREAVWCYARGTSSVRPVTTASEWIPATRPPRLVEENPYLFSDSEEVLISDGKRIRVGVYRVWDSFDDDPFEELWVISDSGGHTMENVVAWKPLPLLPHGELHDNND